MHFLHHISMDLLIAVLIGLSVLIPVALAADPDPLQDLCVADLNSSVPINGFACKPIAAVTVEDFISRTLGTVQPNTKPNTLVLTPLLVQQFPGLNTAGIGLAQVDLGPGAVNVPHLHPRSTELIIIQEGKLKVGFVDTRNTLFIQVLGKGDVILIPKGVVHFQLNVGDSPARFVAIFNSQNPGVVRLPVTLFGSGIPDEVLHKSFQLSNDTIADLKHKFTS